MYFQLSTTTDHKPFPSPDPFDLPVGGHFSGWLTQIQIESQGMLSGRDSAWVNAVADVVAALIVNRAPGTSDALRFEMRSKNETSLLSFSELLRHPGRVGQFAFLESKAPWRSISPQPTDWERYAVFALIQLRSSVEVLATLPTPNVSQDELSIVDIPQVVRTYERAASLAMEAMCGLQIARDKRRAAQERIAKSKHAAGVLHKDREALLDKAIDIAMAKSFRTKKAAAEEVINQLPKDNKGTPYDLATVLGWFRERNFSVPKRANAAPGTPSKK
ncbi:hypothetical protein JNX00_10915 [Hydrogenophaga sp. YM1]|uniref:hypothetical protein n=1 Tax=Hydrogenophaga sp. YM1 TaxID=2806262 RepID=UPI00195C594F|nr:hypothetical protein [Hydrogenophaga sp. YM1]QRR36329.1 hypothetical protein JNX00_10915 [Hydrogenophaga sp. YM1]